MNYVITVYRTTCNQLQHFNADTFDRANLLFQNVKLQKFVRKVEVSVILEAWKPDHTER